MSKKRKKTKKNSYSFSKIIIFVLLILIFILSGFIAGYLLSEKKTQKEIKKYQNTLEVLQKKINSLSKEIKKNTKKINQTSLNEPVQSTEVLDYLTSPKPILPPQEIKKPKITIKNKKPKLVIIIDDVSFKYQVNLIKQIPYHITPSFFPPTKVHPNTPIYAKEFPDYMVHVPMQAFHFAHPEPNTLLTTSSFNTIKNRIIQIKKDFPNVKFINNHTGSKFTSNYSAMKKLFKVLKEENLGFVDSKTTPLSKADKAEKIYNIPLFSRNIFLDNIETPEYIRNQLKKAIKIAKKRGYAIAIGHPHKITLLTLKNSKDLLKQVDVIYIDELAKYEKN